jgi:hypothetical protein
LVPAKSSSSQVKASSERCAVNAGDVMICGMFCCSHASPVATVQSCMSWHISGVMKA